MSKERIVDVVMAGITVLVIAAVFHGTGCSNGGIDYGKLINSLTNAAPSIVTPTTTTTTSTTTAPVVKPPFVPDYSGTYHPSFAGVQKPAVMFRYWMTPDMKNMPQTEIPKAATWTMPDGSTVKSEQVGGWFGVAGQLAGAYSLTISGSHTTCVYRIADASKQPQTLKPQ